ncbi:MAG: heavy metal-associated domain-containing protein [Actinomycetes bacterium]
MTEIKVELIESTCACSADGGQCCSENEVRVTTVKIKGMTCEHCEGRVTTELSKLEGVTEVKTSSVAGEAVISSSLELDSELVSAAVIAAGYRVIS